MRVGIVKEIKAGEGRVALTPPMAAELIGAGAELRVETGAGQTARFDDSTYEAAGAKIVADAAEVWSRSDLLLKVKEPQPSEYRYFRHGMTLMAYLHVAGNRSLAQALIERQVTAIAAELVGDDDEYRPILEPMLEIAGQMGIVLALAHSASTAGGRGKIAGSVAGIAPARIRILGANTMAFQAARTACALGADVFLLDPDEQRLRRAMDAVPGLRTLVCHPDVLARAVASADILVNTFPWAPGQPGYLVTREHVRTMRPRALLLDLAADDAGAVETSRPTTLDDPTYVEEGVVHLCVPNVASSMARSSTRALCNATRPFVQVIQEMGTRHALRVNEDLRRGLVTIDGHITEPFTADWYGVTAVRPRMVLGMDH